MSLKEKLLKNSRLKAKSLDESEYHSSVDTAPTRVPMLNVAFSGTIDGGITSGVTIIAGPSRHYKSGLALLAAGAYLEKYQDAMMLFYDSEFGTPKSYFESQGIPSERVIHTPIMNIEELKFDLIAQLKDLERGERVVVVVDSIGNLASKKEIEDAENQKSVVDMTRAKALKGLFRMITPQIKTRDIPFIGIAHTYDTQEMYSKKVISGGTGLIYSADTALIMGRRKRKEGKEVLGYDFVVNVEKSRFVKEGSQIPLTITWEEGVHRTSGLLDVALAGQFVAKPKMGWYCKVDTETGELLTPNVRESATREYDWWSEILSNTDFGDFVKKVYAIEGGGNADSSVVMEANGGTEDV